MLALAVDAAAKAGGGFPIGYVIGGLMVVIGIAGGIYGSMLRIRGRPPRK